MRKNIWKSYIFKLDKRYVRISLLFIQATKALVPHLKLTKNISIVADTSVSQSQYKCNETYWKFISGVALHNKMYKRNVNPALIGYSTSFFFFSQLYSTEITMKFPNFYKGTYYNINRVLLTRVLLKYPLVFGNHKRLSDKFILIYHKFSLLSSSFTCGRPNSSKVKNYDIILIF